MPIKHLAGRAITEVMPQRFMPLIDVGFETEIFYSFVIIVCSLMIYFGTKELYELSSYKGIKYFRQTFLFFALAYFFRIFIKFLLKYFNVIAVFDIPHKFFHCSIGPITLFVFMYFSSMAIFYLLYSVMWKKWKNKSNRIYLFHLLAFLIAILTLLFRNPLIHFGINIFLLCFVLFTFLVSCKKTKSKKTKYNLHIIYALLFFFWIINIIDILVPNFFHTFQLLIYLSSVGIFLTILYKVLKKAGSI